MFSYPVFGFLERPYGRILLIIPVYLNCGPDRSVEAYMKDESKILGLDKEVGLTESLMKIIKIVDSQLI